MTALERAHGYIGLKEVAGPLSNPEILAMLQMDGNSWVKDDATAWCSAFANKVAADCGLERSKRLNARSWLKVGTPIDVAGAQPGNVVVILKRGLDPQPGPEVTDAPGHVGFLAGFDARGRVLLLAGNQGDAVSIMAFPIAQVLGARLLSPISEKVVS